MAKRLRSIPPVIPHYPPDNDRGAYAPQLWYGDDEAPVLRLKAIVLQS